eukprot:TRINITY_DN33938_c0_g1_i1.p1 TRINITY_DN33938_c0_g1~~TRINITY_DN33938_c0_g1_i1.p1  ORF type:complete len:200 (-),score=58.95 TRINITY_DN33938_c0_g1_i1:224-823(-)
MDAQPGAAADAPLAAMASAPLSDDERAALEELQELLKLDFKKGIEQLSDGPAELLPHLLLGSGDDARRPRELLARGVTHVLNCAGAAVKTGADFYQPYGIEYNEFKSEDTQGYNIIQHYEQAASLADAVAAKGGRLFVHCEAGVNRSGSLLLAYYCLSTGTPLLASARHCKAQRGRICTNKGFQLQVFEFVRSRGSLLQ